MPGRPPARKPAPTHADVRGAGQRPFHSSGCDVRGTVRTPGRLRDQALLMGHDGAMSASSSTAADGVVHPTRDDPVLASAAEVLGGPGG